MASLYTSASSSVLLSYSSQAISSEVHARLSHDGLRSAARSNNSVLTLKLSFPGVPFKSTVGIQRVTLKPLLVTTTSSGQHRSGNSTEYWGNAPVGCWDSEVGTYLNQTSTNIVEADKSTSRCKQICVFCGSSSGKKGIRYTHVAEELGTELVKRRISLVYGGSVGLMGEVAKTVQDAGGHVVGVFPRANLMQGVWGDTIGELVALNEEMARRADAFIALPGGLGTLEEVLEMSTFAQLGISKKPIGLLNVGGFFDPILCWFDKALQFGVLDRANHDIVVSARTAVELLDKLEAYTLTVD